MNVVLHYAFVIIEIQATMATVANAIPAEKHPQKLQPIRPASAKGMKNGKLNGTRMRVSRAIRETDGKS